MDRKPYGDSVIFIYRPVCIIAMCHSVVTIGPAGAPHKALLGHLHIFNFCSATSRARAQHVALSLSPFHCHLARSVGPHVLSKGEESRGLSANGHPSEPAQPPPTPKQTARHQILSLLPMVGITCVACVTYSND